MLHFRISRFAGSLLALLCLSVIGVSRSQAQTLTYSFTTGMNPGAVSPATGLLVFTPDETVSLVSFSYLGTDGITPLANGQLFYVELPLGTDFSSLSEEETYGALSIGVSTGASIVDGAWVFPASSLQFTPDHTYWLYTDGNVGGVGIGESGDGRNGGVTWIGFAVQGGELFQLLAGGDARARAGDLRHLRGSLGPRCHGSVAARCAETATRVLRPNAACG